MKCADCKNYFLDKEMIPCCKWHEGAELSKELLEFDEAQDCGGFEKRS